MTIEFNHWPLESAQRYRDKGYWLDKQLTHLLQERSQSQPDAPAIICGDRHFSYAELDQLSSNLASRLAASGLGNGDTALVQLPNIAEFYIVLLPCSSQESHPSTRSTAIANLNSRVTPNKSRQRC